MRPAVRGDVLVGRARVERLLGAGHDRHAGADRRVARRGLAAHQRDGVRRRADEGQAGVADTRARSAAFSARKP